MKRSIAVGLAALAVVGLLMTLTVRAPTGQRSDPFRAMNFRVEIDGVVVGSFSEASGIGSETTVIEYKDGTTGQIFLLPGDTHYSPVTLKRGMTDNMELWNWRQDVIDGKLDRKSMSIAILNAGGSEVARYNFVNAWPSKMSIGPLSANSNEVLVEEIVIVHEGFVRVK